MTSHGDLRIGDVERDAAMAALREHYAQGRLTHEELDERLGLTLSARTGRELALAQENLPDLYGAASPAGPYGVGGDGPRARRTGGRPDLRTGWRAEWRAELRAERREAWRRHAAGPHGSRPPGHRHPTAHRGGPPPLAPLLFVLLVAGVAFAGFGVLKFVFLAWLVMTLFRVLHHRGHARRAGRSGAF
ncbi:DUF1707 SHOCT-like domain-containing protein [Planomonospora venezuelensis]|uniref:DUF1707 domain-containing protein n=1 Tax=Planomonospora venezuelensis TaxID=1999 RepID=A0A841D816_PLAVE|nr:DUF1707 domain-containing protein [Planomonospora venezuelensis]MBB5964295.1 hypothetical protein [Planomonospora venezuelensis]GIM98552.1 hypothetical protein Pve01_02110 [Planomonospora venezuelensis]